MIWIQNWQKTKVVLLVHCTIANNDCQQNSGVLYIFVPNKSFGQLLNISTKNSTFLKTFNSEVSYIEVMFTDQSSKPLEIENKIVEHVKNEVLFNWT